MVFSEEERLNHELDKVRKEASYYKRIAARTGKLRLREAENLSLTIQNLKQAKDNLSKEIEERKRIEMELRNSEAKYRSIMESMNDEAYVVSPDHLIEYMNSAMADRIGRDSIGKSCHKVIYDLDEMCPWCPFEKVREGIPVEYELLNPINNHYYTIISTPVYQNEGGISKLTISRDITDKKAIEAELRQARKMESIGILAGGIAHDFNNLLQVIIGSTELSLLDIPDGNPVRVNLEKIKKSGNRAKGIVHQLLNFSRKTDLEKKTIDISSVIRDTLKFLRSMIPNTINIRHHLPNRNISILGDGVQISQILINVCTNAFQAMEETGGILDITVDTVFLGNEDVKGHPDLLPGEYASITISDSGPGMDPKIIDRVFDPYFTTKEVGKGSGMGLAVVHGIVKNHSGIVTADSRLGHGATFSIFLPMVNESPETEVKPEEDALPSGNESVLFVDDEFFISEMVEKILKRLGYSVETRTDPVDALELFKTDPDRFDLVITDMTMPGMTGTRLYKRLISVRPDIPTILCTGYSTLIDEEKAKKLGINAFVTKPFSPQHLAVTIRNVLDEKRTGTASVG